MAKIVFDYDVSFVRFLGTYASVDDVIALDERELAQIGGSFDAIASRMELILEYAYTAPRGNTFGALATPLFDDHVTILFYGLTKGFQVCPFTHCDSNSWSDVVRIENPHTQRRLTINKGILHLARDHHLLEKGNEYGISAKEFYDHFI